MTVVRLIPLAAGWLVAALVSPVARAARAPTIALLPIQAPLPWSSAQLELMEAAMRNATFARPDRLHVLTIDETAVVWPPAPEPVLPHNWGAWHKPVPPSCEPTLISGVLRKLHAKLALCVSFESEQPPRARLRLIDEHGKERANVAAAGKERAKTGSATSSEDSIELALVDVIERLIGAPARVPASATHSAVDDDRALRQLDRADARAGEARAAPPLEAGASESPARLDRRIAAFLANDARVWADERARRALPAGGVTVDAISASCNAGAGQACERALDFFCPTTPAQRDAAKARVKPALSRNCEAGEARACSLLGGAVFRRRACQLGDSYACEDVVAAADPLISPGPAEDRARVARTACAAGEPLGCDALVVLEIDVDTARARALELRRVHCQETIALCDGLAAKEGTRERQPDADLEARACIAVNLRRECDGIPARWRANQDENGLRDLCDSGGAEACADLGATLADAHDDDAAARAYLRGCGLSAGQDSCNALADFYRDGRFLARNPERATALMGRACNIGPEVSCRLRRRTAP